MGRELLKTFRENNNATQKEMSDKLSISLSHYKKLECGLKNPSIELLKKMIQVFPELNINQIFLN